MLLRLIACHAVNLVGVRPQRAPSVPNPLISSPLKESPVSATAAAEAQTMTAIESAERNRPPADRTEIRFVIIA